MDVLNESIQIKKLCIIVRFLAKNAKIPAKTAKINLCILCVFRAFKT